MWSRFLPFVQKYNLFEKDDHLLLAMSGGVDSMVLGHLLVRAGVSFEVAHCNFQLRGKDSNLDQELVEKWCRQQRVTCHNRQFQLISAAEGKSVQLEARRVRYEWFEELMSRHQYNKLVTAHHASDNAETLFINLLRGTGAKGWVGIPIEDNNRIRPLLLFSKSEILKYAASNSVEFREDESNSGDQYLRNRIRHQIVPSFSELKPGFESRVSENQMMLGQFVHLTSKLIDLQNPGVFKQEDQQTIIHYRKIQPEEFADLILFYWLQPFGFSAAQSSEILLSPSTGKQFFSVSHRLLINRDELLIQSYTTESSQNETTEIFRGQETVDWPLRLHISEVTTHDFSIPKVASMAALDMDKLSFPLLLRIWRKGDRFQPLGMRQQKLISDFLIDEKVNRFDKEQQWVLESNGRIVWLVGRRIADWASVTDKTKHVLLLALNKGS